MKACFIVLHISRGEYYQTTLADSLLCVLQQNVAGTDIHTVWELYFFDLREIASICKEKHLAAAFDCPPTSIPATLPNRYCQTKCDLRCVITGNEHHFAFTQYPGNQITPPVLHIRIESTGEIIAQLCRYSQTQFAQMLPEFF